MNEPSVLYVVPVYNAAPFLQESLGSVFSQTYANIHVLCVDDGSTDQSFEILQQLAHGHENLTVISQKNAGPGAAFNKGIQFAIENGYLYIARMDADDISLPPRTQKQVAIMEAEPAVAACSCNSTYFSETRECCGKSNVPVASEAIRAEILAGGRGLIQGATLFRTSAIREVGGYRAEKTPAEDTDIFLRLSEHYSLQNIGEELYRIRIFSGSHSLGNIYSTRLYHHYYLHLASLRMTGEREISFDEYVGRMPLMSKAAVRKEAFAISAYFKWMTERSFFALALAAALDPRRTFRRIVKRCCG
jgi:glycosyltransferase involved in cell wall biosynthesis